MNYLLDTHSLIWLIQGDLRLSEKAKIIAEDMNSIIYFSSLSLWEIAIKINIRKLNLSKDFSIFKKIVYEAALIKIDLKEKHIENYIQLPLHHRAPFDRMIISQAQTENLTIITKDKNFSLYNVDILW